MIHVQDAYALDVYALDACALKIYTMERPRLTLLHTNALELETF